MLFSRPGGNVNETNRDFIMGGVHYYGLIFSTAQLRSGMGFEQIAAAACLGNARDPEIAYFDNVVNNNYAAAHYVYQHV